MGILFGLAEILFGAAGLSYVNKRDQQNLAQRRAYTESIYGNGSVSYTDREQLAKEKMREILNYFDGRFNYYLNNNSAIREKETLQKIEKFSGIEKEYLLRHLCSTNAFTDLNDKYCPNYTEMYWNNDDRTYPYKPSGSDFGTIDNLVNIAQAEVRKEVYRRGDVPEFMTSRQAPLYGKALYFQRTRGYENCVLPKEYYGLYADPKWDGKKVIMDTMIEGVKQKDDYYMKQIQEYKRLKEEGKLR